MADLSYEDEWDPNKIFDGLPPYRSPTPPNASITSSNFSNSSFLRLPTEIRLRTYSFCLVNPSPIIVWSAHLTRPWPQKRYRLHWNRERKASSIRNLALGLLRCSTTIAVESAQVFYHNNTFRFEGEHDYYPVITWLHKLDKNREYLQSLEVTVRTPEIAWQLPDGSRRKMSRSRTRGISSHHPYLAPLAGSYEEGEVDIVDPAIETIIFLLSICEDYEDQRCMILFLDTGWDTIPGVELHAEEDNTRFSLDLPNLVDIWRTKYFSDTNQGALEIVWKAEVGREDFREKRHMIEGVGWKIFDVHEAEHQYGFGGTPGWDMMAPTMHFLMKRDEITEPILAVDPSPYTRWHKRPFDDESI
ncbi:MAG: hypothetical protein Q9222_006339 [Ikaeria aurantiellina]